MCVYRLSLFELEVSWKSSMYYMYVQRESLALKQNVCTIFYIKAYL